MSLRSAISLVEPALAALGLESLAALQIVEAGRVATLHHPPLNPDVSALLVGAQPGDYAGVQAALLNQYPPEHPIALVETAAGRVRELGLGVLAEAEGGADVIHVPPLAQPGSFERFQETIAHLRAPEGCPWDRKQTHESLRPYLLEETYEVLAALDAGDAAALREELGDLLLQIVLHSQIAVGAGEFRMADVIAQIQAKIVRRHPHVWGAVNVRDESEVLVNWDRLKQEEKQASEGRESRLDGVPQALPALAQAYSYQDRAARVHFDWDTVQPVIDKIYEEIGEVLAAETPAEREGELGDLLFAVVNWARWLDVEPESALRGTNNRFYRRFQYIEQQAAAQQRPLESMSLAEMDVLWEAAKDQGL